jgi:hypothetical protein
LNLDGIGGHVGSGKDEMALICDDPFDILALGKLHGLSESGREIDVKLFAGFTVDELDFGMETHVGTLVL